MPRGMPAAEVEQWGDTAPIPEPYGNRIEEENAGLVDGAAKGGRTCPRRHALHQYVTTGGACDVCGMEVPRGATVMDCRTCNWYSCKDCYNAMPKSAAPEGDGGRTRIRIAVFIAVLLLLGLVGIGSTMGGGPAKAKTSPAAAKRTVEYDEEDAGNDEPEAPASYAFSASVSSESSHVQTMNAKESAAYASENCNDAHAWKDSKGRTCGDYETKNLCTHTGKQGLGWDASEGPMPVAAAAACCFCGGGSEDDHGDFAGGATMVETKNQVTGEVELVVTPKANPVPVQQKDVSGHPAVGSIGGPLSDKGPPGCFMVDLNIGGISKAIVLPGSPGDEFSVDKDCDSKAEMLFDMPAQDQCADGRHRTKHPVNVIINQHETIVGLAGCCTHAKPVVTNPRFGNHEECYNLKTYQKAYQTYVFGEFGDATCAGAGTQAIKTDAECQTAALGKGLHWVGTIDRAGRPAGCFSSQGKIAGFNISPLGRISTGAQRRICRRDDGWKVMAGWVPTGMKIKMTKAKVKRRSREYMQAAAEHPADLEVVNPVAGAGR